MNDILLKINECEQNGQFDAHITPIDYSLCLPVDENFHYVRQGIRERISYFFKNVFIVHPFTNYVNYKRKAKVKGKENLKKVKGAILTCNHVNIFDCLVVKKQVRPRKLFITGGEFNNRKDFLGRMMRVGGMLPLSSNIKAMRNLDKAITKYLDEKKFVLFYPEQSMWYHYEKPRPLKDGAFHYAVKNNVPIIPMFISFKHRNKYDKEGNELLEYTLNIMSPIYMREDLDKKGNIKYLKEENEKACRIKYEECYGKPLVYNTIVR